MNKFTHGHKINRLNPSQVFPKIPSFVIVKYDGCIMHFSPQISLLVTLKFNTAVSHACPMVPNHLLLFVLEPKSNNKNEARTKSPKASLKQNYV